MSQGRLLLFVVAGCGIAALSSAGGVRSRAPLPLPPTEAWRRTFNNGTNNDFTGPVTTDGSGYCYFNYVSVKSSTDYVLHTVKLGPAMNVAFDKTEELVGYTGMTPMGVVVGPLISGKQQIYSIVQLQDNTGVNDVRINAFDTAGNQQSGWPTFQGSFAQGADCNFVGAGTDAAGNFYFGVSNANAQSQRQFYMLTTNTNGVTTGVAADTNIDPWTARYSKTKGVWIVAGKDLATASPNSSRWATVDPATGTEGLFNEALGSADAGTGAFVGQEYQVGLMPDDSFVVLLDTGSNAGGGASTYLSYWLQMYQASGLTGFRYPTSGSAVGFVQNMAGLNGNVYLVEQNAALTKPAVTLLAPDGTVVYRHTNQPVDRLFPDPTGFYSEWYSTSNNTVYLEHYNNGGLVYDWGKSYTGNSAATNSWGGLAMFQNFFYFALNINSTTTGNDVIVDRFVTGICLQGISSSGTVTGGNSIAVTIQLNGPAPTNGLQVALNSSTAKLLMPNGTRAQNFVVPQGQSSLIVNLNAQTVTSQTVATLLAIQNGIRRPAAVTINP